MPNLTTTAVMPSNVVSIRSEWLTAREATARLNVSKRTIQRRAAAGEIERRTRADGRSEYRITNDVIEGLHPVTSPRGVTPDNATPRDVTPRVTDEGALAALREELTALRVATIDAERRAAVAEYRAQLAETDPAEVEALRARIAETVAERDEARAEAVKLGAAMVKRHGIIQRLTRALTAAQGASK